MFERKKFKAAALQQLKGRWKIPILSTVLTMVIVLVIFFGMFTAMGGNTDSEDASGLQVLLFFIFYVAMLVIAAAFTLAEFKLYDILYKEERQLEFSDFFTALNRWWQALRGFLWMILWIMLWAFVFVIPAYVKMFSYSMMFPILAENPKMSARKAMNISKELTRGYKGDLFVLLLSFLGWMLLAMAPYAASFALGGKLGKPILIAIGLSIYMVGCFILSIYVNLTTTNVYHYLKKVAIESDRIHEEDFE